MLTREELIDKIADLYIRYSDDDGSWDACDITEAVMSLLTHEGADRLGQCPVCATWYPVELYDGCPYYDGHECGGGCGHTNEECTCEDCPTCGCYECECPSCRRCGLVEDDCDCPEEEAVFT
jgi:hypothetical protein